MAVPFIDLKRFEPGFLEAWFAKVRSMSANSHFIGGQEVTQLESALKSVAQVEHVVSCANGTDALQLALRAMCVGRGDCVLVPDLTFWATYEAVINVGADPVTVDVDPTDGGISIDALRQALAEFRPKAAIVVHLYGWGSTRLNEIRAVCREAGVMLVEDGAQCFGVEYQSRSIYAEARIATTSFYPAKVLGAAGDGGAVFTSDVELADRVRRLSNHGRTTHYGYSDVGWNSRLDALQAAYLNLSLPHFETRMASRREAADYYRRMLSPDAVKVMKVPVGYLENGYCNVCIVSDPKRKARLQAVLKESGIGFGNIYPEPISVQKGALPYTRGVVGGKGAAILSAAVVNLPMFPYIKKEELEQVVSAVNSCI
jgi:dTDP-4-amino-4,6-dideoxygalactose transaminase